MLDTVTYEEAVKWAVNRITVKSKLDPPARVVCPNVQLVYLAHRSRRFARIIAASDLVVADGLPLVWASNFLGTPIGGQIRGVDLMESICASGGPLGSKVYILGGLPMAAVIAGERLAAGSKGLRVVGTDCPPVGFESDAALNEAVVERIIAAAPDFLVVALGSPKQEYWTEDNYRKLPACVIIGVGAAVDTIAGLRSRPAVWMRKIGLEWFGRLLSEPRRLWKRYLIGNSTFIYLILRQWIVQKVGTGDIAE
jgi:N-acetylglucosaminyldiphosphoundecaprenol N-acetyl-beta-D-mannosaminyltransferase